MVGEVLTYLRCQNSDGSSEPDNDLGRTKIYIDGTLGTAGHTTAILRANEGNRVIAFDRDSESVRHALERLKSENLESRVAVIQGDFRFAPEMLKKLNQSLLESQESPSEEINFLGDEYLDNFQNSKADSEISEDDDSAEEQGVGARVLFVGRNFPRTPIEKVDGALVDAGMSLFQVSWPDRGLSFREDAPLDMRYDRTRGFSAADLVNRLCQDELEDLFFKFTDERWARRIAATIIEFRRRQFIHTTSELTGIIEVAIPVAVRRHMRVHPSTRVFAALRIAVNDEFWALDEGSWALSTVLANAARLVVLTYSSHEDRTLKRTFRRLAGRPLAAGTSTPRPSAKRHREKTSALSLQRSTFSLRSPLTFSQFSLALPSESQPSGNQTAENQQHRENEEAQVAPDGFGQAWQMKIVTNKPVEPNEEEIDANPLARSCKLRAIEKVETRFTASARK